MGKTASGDLDGILQLAGGILVGGLALYRMGSSSISSEQDNTKSSNVSRKSSVTTTTQSRVETDAPSWQSSKQAFTSNDEVEAVQQEWKSNKKVGYEAPATSIPASREEPASSSSSISEDESIDEMIPSWMSSKNPQTSIHEVNAIHSTGAIKSVHRNSVRELRTAADNVADVSVALSDMVYVYPGGAEQFIGANVNAATATNARGEPVTVQVLQSRAGAGDAVVGALSGGARASILTPSSNLKSMIPSLFEMTQERLPGVLHVGVQQVDSDLVLRQDFSDVMAIRDTGAIVLVSSNAQEIHDLSIVSHAVAEQTSLPTVHAFDGVRMSTQYAKVEVASRGTIGSFVAKCAKENKSSWSSLAAAANFGSNSSSSFVARGIDHVFNNLNKSLGRHYKIFEYFGDQRAESVIVAMGGAADTLIRELTGFGASRVGVIKVRLLRPWSAAHFLDALPASVRKVAVFDQSGTKLAPLFQDVVASFHMHTHRVVPRIVSSKIDPSVGELSPAGAVNLLANILSERPQTNFFVGSSANGSSIHQSGVEYKQIIAFAPADLRHDLNHNSLAISKQLVTKAKVNAQQYVSVDTYNHVARAELRLGQDSVVFPESYQVLEGDSAVVFGDALHASVGAVLHQVKENGSLVVSSEEPIPDNARAQLEQKGIRLFHLNGKQIVRKVLGEDLANHESIVNSGEVWLGLAAALYLAKGEKAFYGVAGYLKAAVTEDLAAAQIQSRLAQRIASTIDSINDHVRVASVPFTPRSFGTPLSMYKKTPSRSVEYLDYDFETKSYASYVSLPSPVARSSSKHDLFSAVNAFTPRLILSSATDENCKNLAILGRGSNDKHSANEQIVNLSLHHAAFPLVFREAYEQSEALRPSAHEVHLVRLTKRTRLTPEEYNRNIFHLEFDISGTSLKYEIGDALGVYGHNDEKEVDAFISEYGIDPHAMIAVPARGQMASNATEIVSMRNLLIQHLDLFGRPSKKFYTSLAGFTSSRYEYLKLMHTGTDDTEAFKLGIHETVTYAELLLQYRTAKPSMTDLVAMIPPIKPRHYSIASSMKLNPRSVHLLVVAVDWVTPLGKYRTGQCTRYLANLDPSKGDCYVAVDVVPSVMRLPSSPEQPVIMAGLGTGMAPFRAFIQERKYQKEMGMEVGPMALYFGARHRHEEYLYGDELDAYKAEGLITELGLAFSRDQKHKVYIQHKIEEDGKILAKYLNEDKGHFYMCGPTWPVPDVRDALAKNLNPEAAARGDVDVSKIEELKKQGRYVLEVY